jgi:hypothetical protein
MQTHHSITRCPIYGLVTRKSNQRISIEEAEKPPCMEFATIEQPALFAMTNESSPYFKMEPLLRVKN